MLHCQLSVHTRVVWSDTTVPQEMFSAAVMVLYSALPVLF